MNRAELQTLAVERLKDAEILLAGGRWPSAYYLAGYSVECALKSCLLAQMIHTGWIFQDKVKISDCLTHDFDDLVVIAGLREVLTHTFKTNPAFAVNWDTVGLWRSTDRYEVKSEAEARTLIAAITEPSDGVLSWIKISW